MADMVVDPAAAALQIAYITELKKYIDDGMVGNSFIEAVSGIVNRGCHNPPCMNEELDGREDRSANFHKVLTVFDL